MTLNCQGDLARCEQRFVDAQPVYQEGIGFLRQINATRDVASMLHNLGYTYLHRWRHGRR
ncbi:MAG: hypothetical protein R2838_20380 [Caldilineaceae bacterium]